MTKCGEAKQFLHEFVLNYDGEDCVDWPYSRGRDGYARIHTNGRSRNVHRVVCEAAHGLPPSETHQAAHSCARGHMGCVAKNHLRWLTPAENRFECHTTKLDAEKVRQIRGLDGSDSEVAKKYGVTPAVIWKIRKNKIWRHVSSSPEVRHAVDHLPPR